MKIQCRHYSKCILKIHCKLVRHNFLFYSCRSRKGYFNLENDELPSCFKKPQLTHKTPLSGDVISDVIAPYLQNSDFCNLRPTNKNIERMTRSQWTRTDTNKRPLRLIPPYKKTQIYCMIRHDNLIIAGGKYMESTSEKGVITIRKLSNINYSKHIPLEKPVVSLDINGNGSEILIVDNTGTIKKCNIDLRKVSIGNCTRKVEYSGHHSYRYTKAAFVGSGFVCSANLLTPVWLARPVLFCRKGQKDQELRKSCVLVINRNTMVLWVPRSHEFWLCQNGVETRHQKEIEYIFKLNQNQFLSIDSKDVATLWKILNTGELRIEMEFCVSNNNYKTDGWSYACLYNQNLILLGHNYGARFIRIFSGTYEVCTNHRLFLEGMPIFADVYKNQLIIGFKDMEGNGSPSLKIFPDILRFIFPSRVPEIPVLEKNCPIEFFL